MVLQLNIFYKKDLGGASLEKLLMVSCLIPKKTQFGLIQFMLTFNSKN